ncbi:poly-beta-1,6-N-acetyl-D-glucosamine biosynthesis protein PgaD [Pollutimonas thiosulfatoxidans]|uniref:Poly-beta-1,6-N-acetyl-D-glucosamine biosynthesis protein PgaD n=1 Tax=Pollutimonas thiosulfatoxidans TaxID=2028345 RepID=A0A410GAM8_9BURK|nr:poly-beta-1,6-N-acetyl-D-glucosamine biosynthesis protein PgaD [Pollutimonas thiosulfatoxidans]MBF6615878.1 poly-beta-1,6-N-acetyl-D-glucosamine biosynthesis protein PgaD [Candidimonas sp.]QAA93317.1 poly-beta-1,6-N-acetyl-D-glucosamine biosynthesis protein PgaD [Pollutimonas thiosulfatoxidans]
MIIQTQRTPGVFALDVVLTAFGWAGFFYLFTRGVLSLLHTLPFRPQVPLLEVFLPTLSTLALYLLVAAFNALLVVLWARYNRIASTSDRAQALPHTEADDDVLAAHFHVSCNQLHEIQDSRVTVIYHSEDGDIAHLETDQLRMQPAGNSPVFETARVA